MKFDLHLHSWFSDGRFSPSELARECYGAGLETIALTDHENTGGIYEAVDIGKTLGIKVIPGIEFSTEYRGEEHHILGYFIDHKNLKLKEFLISGGETKLIQIKAIVENLGQLGFRVTIEDVLAQVKGSLERVHISSAIFQRPENLELLASQGVTERKGFFKKYLLEKPHGEGLAFVERKRLKIEEVIGLIHQISGLVFWAHPFFKIKDKLVIEQRALEFNRLGLDGIEAGYSLHAQEQTIFLRQIAGKLSLYESGGSDAHGDGHKDRKIGNFQAHGAELNFPFNFDCFT